MPFPFQARSVILAWENSLITEEKTSWHVVPRAVKSSHLIFHAVHIYEESDKGFSQSCQDIPKAMAFAEAPRTILEITLLFSFLFLCASFKKKRRSSFGVLNSTGTEGISSRSI